MLLGFLLLFQNNGFELCWVLGRALKPLLENSQEEVRLEIIRAITVHIHHHLREVPENPLVSSVVNHVDAYIELLPKGHRTPHPRP